MLTLVGLNPYSPNAKLQCNAMQQKANFQQEHHDDSFSEEFFLSLYNPISVPFICKRVSKGRQGEEGRTRKRKWGEKEVRRKKKGGEGKCGKEVDGIIPSTTAKCKTDARPCTCRSTKSQILSVILPFSLEKFTLVIAKDSINKSWLDSQNHDHKRPFCGFCDYFGSFPGPEYIWLPAW